MLCSICVGGMMSRRLAGCAARRREDWPSFQVARRSLRAFRASPFGAAPVCSHLFGPSSRQTASLPSPMPLWSANRQER